MINGAHFLLYSKDAEADRAFLRDVLNLRGVDAGGGWLIFALPPAELGVHPSEGNFVQEHAEQPMMGAVLYLMCDDLAAMMAELKSKGVEFTQVQHAEWGDCTSLILPSGGHIGLYQPRHATAI